MGANEARNPLVQLDQNHFEHAARIFENIVVPEPRHLKALLFQIGRPSAVVVRPFGMLAAIDFNDERALTAQEVAEERPDRCLTDELVSVQSPIS